MADPLSISVGILAIINTLRDVATLIDAMKDGPDTLRKARSDLLETVDVLKHIEQSQETDSKKVASNTEKSQYDASMASVLAQCKQLCEEFRDKLSRCISTRSNTAHQFYYRTKTALKSETIEKFRRDLDRSRQIMQIRLQLRSSNVTMQTSEQVDKLYESNERLVQAITSQLESLKISASVSANREESMQATFISLCRKQEAVLMQQLQICEDNRSIVKRMYSSQHSGNTKLGNFPGLKIDETHGAPNQVSGKTGAGDDVWSIDGAAAGCTILSSSEEPSGSSTGVMTPGLLRARSVPSGAGAKAHSTDERTIGQSEKMIMSSQIVENKKTYLEGINLNRAALYTSFVTIVLLAVGLMAWFNGW